MLKSMSEAGATSSAVSALKAVGRGRQSGGIQRFTACGQAFEG